MKPTATTRRCGLSACRQEIPSSHLFCLPHWGQLPIELRDRIRRYWRPGLALADQFPEYVVAVRHALEVLRAPAVAHQAAREPAEGLPAATWPTEAAGCVPLRLKNEPGVVGGFICFGRRRRKLRACSWCNRPASAERECDYKAPGAAKTCDKPLCRSCAVPAGKLADGDRADHCPGHPKPLPGPTA